MCEYSNGRKFHLPNFSINMKVLFLLLYISVYILKIIKGSNFDEKYIYSQAFLIYETFLWRYQPITFYIAITYGHHSWKDRTFKKCVFVMVQMVDIPETFKSSNYDRVFEQPPSLCYLLNKCIYAPCTSNGSS